MNKIKLYSLLFSFVLLAQSCGVKYSLSGTSIPKEMKTVSVEFFENGAPLVVPYLSQQFTDALKDRIRSQSSLSIVRADANANFEGRITNYSISPTAIQGNDRAGLNRITITISVKYTNILKPEQGFDAPFTESKDFSIATSSIQAQEQGLIRDLNAKLTEDIFNRAFANW